MKDVLQFVKKSRPRPSSGGNILRVSGPAYNIVNEIAWETGRTASSIASEMLLFAYKHCELVDEADDEKEEGEKM